MRVGKVSENITRLLLAAIIGLVLAGSFSTPVKAEGNPVDLVLGGEGATSWSIVNIKPGDSGIKTVELHNTGSKDGFVTIWVSDVVSGEGINPESETGDTAEPGEFTDYLLLNLTADGLFSNIDLPATISNLPRSATWPDYIELIPLKAGDTVDLQWDWELPVQTGNDAQGDNISFTTNYLLREFEITDVSEVVTDEGIFTEEVTVEPEGGQAQITIEEDITGQTKEGEPISEIWFIEIDKEPSAPSEDTAAIGFHYDAGPDGTTFDKPITITLTYDPDNLPPRASEGNLVIALWDEAAGEWVELTGCIVDTVNNTISAPIDHFSRYTTIVYVPPPEEEEEVPPPVPAPSLLAADMLGETGEVEIGTDGTLHESLTLSDSNENFVLEIDSGSKITGSDGLPITRIELTVTEESFSAPDDIVILSPIYKLSGYTNSIEVTRINFDPFATLTIRYDPENLPENTFPPFIATYTDEQSLIWLQPPPDSAVGIGEAKALIDHASFFLVATEVAPPPLPLPARFEANTLIINPQQAQLGQPVTISLTITNEGAIEGSHELHLIIDGIVRMVTEVTLAGNSSETLTFEVSNLAVGKHQVKIAGLTGQFRVEMTTTPLIEGGVNWLLIDMSVGAVLAIGAFVLYSITRRSRQL
ncbi:hypothetical protein ACFLX8_04370 [Chloroflexota bacterium]